MDYLKNPITSIGFVVYAALLLAIALYSFIQSLKRPAHIILPDTTDCWRISWGEFLIFFLGAFMVSLSGPYIICWACTNENLIHRGIVTAFLTQIFLFFYLLPWILYKPSLWWETIPKRSLSWNTIKIIFIQFGISLPLLWLTGGFWELIFKIWQNLGWNNIKPEPQWLVHAFMTESSLGFRILFFIFAVLIAPLTEELIFRAGLYRHLKLWVSPRKALIVSALVFAAFHFELTAFLPLFLLGLLLGRLYEITRNIYSSMIFHAIFNLNTLLLLWIWPGIAD